MKLSKKELAYRLRLCIITELEPLDLLVIILQSYLESITKEELEELARDVHLKDWWAVNEKEAW